MQYLLFLLKLRRQKVTWSFLLDSAWYGVGWLLRFLNLHTLQLSNARGRIIEGSQQSRVVVLIGVIVWEC